MKNIPSLEEQQNSVPFVETDKWREAYHAPKAPNSLGYLGNSLPAGIIGDPPDVDGMSAEEIADELSRRGIDPEPSFKAVHAMLDAVQYVHESNRAAYEELQKCEQNALAELSISNDERDHYRRENEAMRAAIRESHAALGGCLKYILRLPLSGSVSECETMDDAHHALRKLKPFLP